MSGVSAYGCSTAAGLGVNALWEGVHSGHDFSTLNSEGHKACYFSGPRDQSARERMLFHMMKSFNELGVRNLDKLGVILATTKGFVEDEIWKSDADLTADFISPLLNDFIKVSELNVVAETVVSNACSSALSAVWLAERWLKSGRCENVLVLAVDGVGPFVLKGFRSLHVLTSSTARPFSASRDGLQLGEAAGALLLSRDPQKINVSGVAIDTEGHAVTRPSPGGESLKRAIEKLPRVTPDLILAHATGTQINDQTEDKVFFELYGQKPKITGSKWSIGHTLGASGLMDLILGFESIRRKTAFALGNTTSLDSEMRGEYLLAGHNIDVAPCRVLVSSLGFGGIHAAAMIEGEA